MYIVTYTFYDEMIEADYKEKRTFNSLEEAKAFITDKQWSSEYDDFKIIEK